MKKLRDAMLSSSFSRYFCSCLRPKPAPKKTRKALRQELLASRSPPASPVVYSPVPQAEDPDVDLGLEELRRQRASVRIQALVRGFLGRALYQKTLLQAIEEADKYWLYIYWLRAEEERMQRLRELARTQFAHQYVHDVVDTSVLAVIQAHEACLTIQRTWRGHRCRMRRPKRPPPKPRRLRPRILPGRHSAATLRRVWARMMFEPEKPYIHNTDFNYLVYDMWEHVDRPPAGLEHGLVTRKVHAVPASEREELILARDRHAWVGLPVGYEETSALQKRQEEERKRLSSALPSPYDPQPMPKALRALVTIPASPLPQSQQADTATATTTVALAGDAVGRTLQRMGYDISQEVRLEARDLLKRKGAQTSLAALRLPKIGDIMYDPSTGHLLSYRRGLDGLGWRGVRNGKLVHLRQPLDDVPQLPLHVLPVSLSLPISTASTAFLPPPTSPLASIATGTTGLRTLSLLTSPSIHRQRSGYVQVDNPSFSDAQSELLQTHRAQFLEAALQSGEVVAPQVFPSNDFAQDNPSWTMPARTIEYTRQGTPVRGGHKMRPLAATLSAPSTAKSTRKPPSYRATREGLSAVQDRISTAEADQLASVAEEWSQQNGLQPPTSMSAWSAYQTALETRSTLGPILSLENLGDLNPLMEEFEQQDVWSRSVFCPPHEAISRLLPQSSRRKPLYRLQYQWIPQPLVHNAVHSAIVRPLFSSEGSLRAEQARSMYRRDVHSEIREQSARLQLRRQRDQLLSIVTDGGTSSFYGGAELGDELSSPGGTLERDGTASGRGLDGGSFYLSDMISPMRYYYDDDDITMRSPQGSPSMGSPSSGRKKVFRDEDSQSTHEAESARHPQRQHLQTLSGLRPRAIWVAGRAEDDISSLQSQDQSSLASMSGSMSSTLPSYSVAPVMPTVSTVATLDTVAATDGKSRRLAYQTFLSSVPEGRMPDTEALQNELRATAIERDGDVLPVPPTAYPEEDLVNRKTKGLQTRKFRFPILSRKPPKDMTVHPYEWH